MQKGIKLERTSPDKKNPNMNIFLFEDSERLQKVITEYNKNLK